MHSLATMSTQQPKPEQEPAVAADAQPDDRPARTAASRRIAIVEDELAVAWSLQTTAEDLGHEVIGVFASGEAALDVLALEQADLLFIDIALGEGIDGIETARLLREQRPIGVLFITGSPDRETYARIVEAVPDAKMIGKPVFREALEEAVAALGVPRG